MTETWRRTEIVQETPGGKYHHPLQDSIYTVSTARDVDCANSCALGGSRRKVPRPTGNAHEMRRDLTLRQLHDMICIYLHLIEVARCHPYVIATIRTNAIARRRHISALSCSLNGCSVHLVQRAGRCVGQRESDDVDSPLLVNPSACCACNGSLFISCHGSGDQKKSVHRGIRLVSQGHAGRHPLG
jgi:hypothetical protein